MTESTRTWIEAAQLEARETGESVVKVLARWRIESSAGDGRLTHEIAAALACVREQSASKETDYSARVAASLARATADGNDSASWGAN